jgi:hypothetical protein
VASRSERPKIVVSSGWWCDYETPAWRIGDPATRSPGFFELWYRLVMKYIEPTRIVVTDSAAPLKPAPAYRERVTWIELDRNYGHANDIRFGLSITKYSGGSRARILGCAYALCCDADYYMYVEQDCLVHGEHLLDAALDGTTEAVVVGGPTEGGRGLVPGTIALPMLQNSLIIVRRDGLERLLHAMILAAETDGELPPEKKMERDYAPYELLAIPYGRSRPIDFTRSHFYAQHLTASELAEFCSLEGEPIPRADLAGVSARRQP